MLKREYAMFVAFIIAILTPSNVHAQDDISVEIEEAADGDEDTLNDNKSIVIGYYEMGGGLDFASASDSYNINLSGYVQTTFHSQKFPEDNDFYSRFRIRRARLRLNGDAYQKKIRYRLGVDLVKGSETDASGAGSMLTDAWIAYHSLGNNKFSIAIGQKSTPTDNRELQMNSATMMFIERSKLSSYFGTIREVGIFMSGTYKIGTISYLRPSIAITDGDGPINGGTRYGGLKYGARINYLPFGLFRLAGETRQADMAYEFTPKVSLGAAYSYNDGVSDRRGGRESGSILYQNKDGNTELPDMSKLTVDILFKYRGFSLLGEYARSMAHVPSSIYYRVRNDGTVSSDFSVDGTQDVENYIKNRMMLGSVVNIQAGYFFRSYWSIAGRYTHVMPDKNSYMNNDLYFNRSDFYDLGLSKYLGKSQAVKVQANFGLAKTAGLCRKSNGETFDGWEKSFTILFQLAF